MLLSAAAVLSCATSLLAQNLVPVRLALEPIVTNLHAEGVQLYECKPNSDSKLTWHFREPVAILVQEGKTIGRHFSGPKWEHEDGSVVFGKIISSIPGATSNDIPWLKLDAIEHRGDGMFANVTNIQRINTKGGMAEGQCSTVGSYLSVPYSADYVFQRDRSQSLTR